MGLALALCVGCSVAVVSDDATACINGSERRLHEHVAAIAKAELEVAEGKPRTAATAVLNRYPGIRKQTIGRNGVADRGLRVMARAVVRTNGAIDAGKRFPGASDADRKQNMVWATRVLHGFSNRNPKDAVATTDYGEALARQPLRQREALRVLARLADDDRMATPHGYAALAELHRRAGEGKEALIAHPAQMLAHARATLADARCRRMTVDEEAVCDHAPAGPSS
jgi:hypothetical protein